MPIEFQPAAPTGGNAASSYGAAQQSAQDMPVTANLYEAAARMTQQNQLAGLEHQQRAQEAATRAQLEDRHQQMAFAGQQDQTALAYAGMAHQERMVDLHAQAQAYVRERDLTFQDQLRKQQLDQALSEVDKAYANGTGTIDQDTYTAMVLKVKAQLDPIELKHQAALSKLRVAQTTDLTEQAKLRAALSNTDAAVRAQAANQLTFNLRNPATGSYFTDPATGEPMAYHLDPHGVPVPLSGKAGGADAAKQQQFQYKAELDAGKEWDKHYAATKALVNSWSKETVRGEDGKTKLRYEELGQTPYFDKRLEDELAKNKEYGADREAYVRKRLAKFQKPDAAGAALDAATGGAAGGAGAAGQSQGQGGGQPDLEAARQKVIADNPPFHPDELAAASPDQRKQVDTWRMFGREVGGAVPADQAPAWKAEAEWAVRALAQFGTVERMPDDVRGRYEHVRMAFAGLGKPKGRRPEPEFNTGGAFGAGGF